MKRQRWDREADPLDWEDQSSTMNPLLKRTAEEASAPVVGILAHLESNSRNGKFISSVLTTASVLRPYPDVNEVRNNIEISITLANDVTCKGVVVAFDFHYNIGVIEIETDAPVDTARLKLIDDSITIDPNALYENPPGDDNQLHKYILLPGTTVVALGRYHDKGYNKLMIVAGEFSLAALRLDYCKDLFRANLRISKHGIGGPVMNSNGEVIGISFFYELCTPFLPINIVSMWWEQLKTKRMCRVPYLGMEVGNLYTCGSIYLEYVIQRFPNIFKGVVIRKITLECLRIAEILVSDLIVKCDEKPVGSILELFELIWNKAGEPVNLTVVRPTDGSCRCVTVTFDDVGPDQMYSWPLEIDWYADLERCAKWPWKWI